MSRLGGLGGFVPHIGGCVLVGGRRVVDFGIGGFRAKKNASLRLALMGRRCGYTVAGWLIHLERNAFFAWASIWRKVLLTSLQVDIIKIIVNYIKKQKEECRPRSGRYPHT